ncbi:MAG: L-ribulose-5-phosphate 4-epimerase [Clostridia bacterium]|nr:L-ribulose-5-phosphate 4-epimerase [Clostridia bacterium]
MLYTLKKEVMEANIDLERHRLVGFTWGNVSGIDREEGIVVIKPSGIPYSELKVDQMVVIDLEGNVIEGDMRPSSDTPTHLELYKSFPEIGGVCHTHSLWATSFAQAKRGIPVFGTTHADNFRGEIPCSRPYTNDEIQGDYEKNTGKLIVETFRGKNPYEIPGVLVAAHGPFTWGKNASDAVINARVMEFVAEAAYRTSLLNRESRSINKVLRDKHYLRKHGDDAYYGQD